MIPLGGAIAKNLPDGLVRIALPVIGFVMFSVAGCSHPCPVVEPDQVAD